MAILPAKVNYYEYIMSDAWRRKRKAYWASNLRKDCFVCGCKRQAGFHLHHLTYERLGNERLEDLVPVCEPCHVMIHNNEKKHPNMSLREVTHFTQKNYLKEKELEAKQAAITQHIIDNPYVARGLDPKLFGTPRKKRKIQRRHAESQSRKTKT